LNQARTLAGVNLPGMNVMLRPPGNGNISASTGSSPQAVRLHQRMYGTSDSAEIRRSWVKNLRESASAPAYLLGVPSDTGAGATRGSTLGPIGVREAFYASPQTSGSHFADAGDVFCIPHLLHDSMLIPELMASCRKEIYGDANTDLPVSPLSIAELVAEQLTSGPQPPALVGIGGDHSVSAALVLCHLRRYPKTLGILHLDAHNDLSSARFGVPITYSSWLLHLERQQSLAALAQIGLEHAVGCPDLGSRLLQFRNTDCSDVGTVARQITRWFEGLGIRQLYISVDVDVTAVESAPATGTPARDGLSPDTVCELISSIAPRFQLVGADVVEVAPSLAADPDWPNEVTCQTAASYLNAILQSMPGN